MTQTQQKYYPRLWWHNGIYEQGTNGYFYTTQKEFGYLVDPWKPVQLNRYDEGYQVPELKLAVIRRRSQAFTEETVNGQRKIVWIDRHERGGKGYRYYTELLCFMDGYDGPVTLNLKGFTGSAFTDRYNGLLIQHKRNVRDPLMPSWAYWMHLRAPINPDGSILYTPSKQGINATPPQLVPQEKATPEEQEKLFVGDTLLREGFKLFDDTEEWQAYARTTQEDLGRVW